MVNQLSLVASPSAFEAVNYSTSRRRMDSSLLDDSLLDDSQGVVASVSRS
jgi:hypothetical protein